MSSQSYDVVIIGAGIIGLATALKLTERFPRTRVAVVEKEAGPALHQTGHNSGVIHSGIYYRLGSQKAIRCRSGVESLLPFCDESGVPYDLCGKLIVATGESELPRLDDLYQRGTANGVPGLEIIGPERMREIEPHAAGIKAIYAPGTGIVDFVAVSRAYAARVSDAGGQIFMGAKVTAVRMSGTSANLTTTIGDLECRSVINCAGLHADKVARMMGEEPDVRIIPFRGEYYTLREDSRRLVKGLIYPVPNPRFPFLGVHFTRTIHGTVEAGPNAVLALSREGYRKRDVRLADAAGTFTYRGFWAMSAKTWRTGLGEMYRSWSKRVFLKDLRRLVPEVRGSDLASGGSGVRAQAVDRSGRLLDDFSIQQARGAIHVLNAPSPGATSSLAIGDHIVDLAAANFDLGREN